MKTYKEKLNVPDPHDPAVTARVLEFIGSMTPDEAIEFLEYRTLGVPEYWFGEPIVKNGQTKPKTTETRDLAD
jgi:hypothetical protein